MADPLLQPDDVCTQLGITKRTLYEMVQTGRIEHIKLNGRLLRFRQHQLDAWIDAQTIPVRLRTTPLTRRFRVS